MQRSGVDVGRALTGGAEFTFKGRALMYEVSALEKTGSDHTISILKTQLLQMMQQLCSEHTLDISRRMAGSFELIGHNNL